MIKTNRLPKEYQEVEYIESSGTQYIDTGVLPLNVNHLVFKGIITATTIDSCFYGSGASGNFVLNTMSGMYQLGVGGYTNISNSQARNVLHNIEIFASGSQQKLIVDNETLVNNTETKTIINTQTIYLFGRNTNGSLGLPMKGKMYYFKMYNNDTLIKDFVPCYRKSDNVIGMYDLITDTFYVNKGTGTFTKGNNVQPKVKNIIVHKNNNIDEVMYIKTKVNNSMVKVYDQLPNEYQRVEYIENTGTQYIDTGLYPLDVTKYKIDASLESVWGSRSSNFHSAYLPNATSGSIIYSAMQVNASGYIGLGYSGGWINTPIKWNVGERHIVETELIENNQNVKLDGETIYTGTSTNTRPATDITIVLFVYQYSNNRFTNYGWKGRVYSVKLYGNNDELVRNYVPCYRKSDNVIGLYDLVNNVFYTNAGTDNFVKGNDI